MSNLGTSPASRSDYPLHESQSMRASLQLGKRVRALISRLRRNEQGVAAVEFALIVPIMFLLLAGALEFSQAITVDRRVTQVASSTADLVARVDKFNNNGEIDNILKIIEQLFSPYDVAPLTVSVISVQAKAKSGNPAVTEMRVSWSRDTKGQIPYTANTIYGHIPAGLLAQGESVIVGEANYTYTPLLFKYFIMEAFGMQERFYLKPRQKACVSLAPTNCVTGNPF
jgi:Flp pilus assembly protein TadG